MNETRQLFGQPAIRLPSETIKACCTAVYQSDWTRLLLGDSFHPGGLPLTQRLGELLELGPGRRVLDVAAGKGTSAIFLAKEFGCDVVGVEYGEALVTEAAAAAAEVGATDRVRFEQGDAERLPFSDDSFDAILCECAFCTFPDKPTAAAEFARVLKPGGRLGLSDLTRSGPLPPELDTLLGWVACIADAQPVAQYRAYLEDAGLIIGAIEAHDQALNDLIRQIQGRLLGAELLVKLNKLALPGADFGQAKQLARLAANTVRQGKLGYAVITGTAATSM
ncbi:MAG: class I SAM-dependent methyltransferase [Anaerolineae bacterium]